MTELVKRKLLLPGPGVVSVMVGRQNRMNVDGNAANLKDFIFSIERVQAVSIVEVQQLREKD